MRRLPLQAVVAQQDSQMELQHVLQSRNKACRPYSSVLLEQEKQRNLEKHKNELADLHKLQAQHREEQQRWEKERERHSGHMEALEAQLKQRQDECSRREQQLQEGNGELQRQREDYQQGLERLRESTRAVEKDKERLGQERERLELLQDKLKKHMSVLGQQGNYDEPAQVRRSCNCHVDVIDPYGLLKPVFYFILNFFNFLELFGCTSILL